MDLLTNPWTPSGYTISMDRTITRIEGNRVIYPPVDGLQSRQAFTYTIEAAAQQPGDVRFQAELRATGLTEPVIKQESTNIYPPPNGNGAAPAPGNQPPGPMPVSPR